MWVSLCMCKGEVRVRYDQNVIYTLLCFVVHEFAGALCMISEMREGVLGGESRFVDFAS